MIFVTVGTESFQFNRFLHIIDLAAHTGRIADEMIIQRGKSKELIGPFQQEEFYSFDKIVEFISKADIVVSHAGIGTTLLSLNLGKIPVLFPRQYRYGEHLDDHQMDFAKKIETTGKVLVAYNEAQLINCLNNYNALVSKLTPSCEHKDRASLVDVLTRCVEEFSQ
jgi:UDP-N-acetylglucosamine transferase subunit ALG13